MCSALLSISVDSLGLSLVSLSLSVCFLVHGVRPEERLVRLHVYGALHDFVARADEAAESAKPRPLR